MLKEFTQIKNEMPTNLVDADILAMWAMSALIEKNTTHRLILNVAPYSSDGNEIYMLQLREDTGALLEDGAKATLYHLYATNCESCKDFASIIDATTELARLLNGQWHELIIDSF